MSPIKKTVFWVGLSIYTILLFLYLSLFRLPLDKLMDASMAGVTGGMLQVKAQKVSFAFPLHIKMEDVALGLVCEGNLVEDKLTSLVISPYCLGIVKGDIPIAIRGAMTGGEVSAKIGISLWRGTDEGYLDLRLRDILLEGLKIPQALLHRDIMGRLRGDLMISGNRRDISTLRGEAHLLIEKGSTSTRFDIPGMERIPFDTMRVAVSMENGIITSKNSDFKGPMFSGNISGQIRLRESASTGTLDLKAEMTPGPLLEKNPVAVEFLKKIRKGSGPVIIKIEGTLNKPSIVWRKN